MPAVPARPFFKTLNPSLSSHQKNLFRDLISQVFQMKDTPLLLKRLCKGEEKPIKPTDSSVADPAKFLRPEVPHMGWLIIDCLPIIIEWARWKA